LNLLSRTCTVRMNFGDNQLAILIVELKSEVSETYDLLIQRYRGRLRHGCFRRYLSCGHFVL